MNWTKEDVNSFIGYIRSLGGQVVKILELMNGYEFYIQPPNKCTSNTWGKDRMNEFMNRR